MANKMLIDASHPEETRVVVLRGDRVEEFDYESASKKQLRGNIYLAKVTRVEPSLQAAFVDYGGNRHGFLAFSEIHPDYYQIPVADRQALLEEEAEDEIKAEAEEYSETSASEKSGTPAEEIIDHDGETPVAEKNLQDIPLETASDQILTEDVPPASFEENEQPDIQAELPDAPEGQASVEDTDIDDADDNVVNLKDYDTSETEEFEENSDVDEDVESVGSEDALEEVPQRVRRRRKSYKIQEVIKRRQVILVQVVKEERGNKGAALTTYLSLAGRHTVLMPNTARGGGISRKITNPADRKRLRKIAGELEIPEGTGLIIRTAGASRTKAEIKRDYEYLLRLWENVRDLTMESTAPSVVYEEGDLIKRSIRDLYSKEIDEVLVSGDDAYHEAKKFMRMIMPSHSKNVKAYKESEPLFIRYAIERQLNEMYSPYVTLYSGGYIVINQTEALVSIDVNSGKSTKEHSIEDTALRTNLEAAEEIARQLRLRDLAGLVVIDFIDMDERRNNRAVEKKLKECLKNDRARIQVGRISHFGLLEMSRQRLRTGVLEGSTSQCPHCQGTGIIRSTDSVALSVLRAIEDTLLTREQVNLIAKTSVDVALYILNQKRAYLKDIEARYDTVITIVADQQLQGANFQIEQAEELENSSSDNVIVKMDWGFQAPEERQSRSEDDDGKRRKKRRRRRRDRNDQNAQTERHESDDLTDDLEEQPQPEVSSSEESSNERRSRTRRRGRRGGRKHRNSPNATEDEFSQKQDVETSHEDTSDNSDNVAESASSEASDNGEENENRSSQKQPRRRFPGRRRRPRKFDRNSDAPSDSEGSSQENNAPVTTSEPTEPAESKSNSDSEPKPSRRRPAKSDKKPAAETAPDMDSKPSGSEIKTPAKKQSEEVYSSSAMGNTESDNSPTRKGWWQKRTEQVK